MAESLHRAEERLGIIDATARAGDRRSFLKWAGAAVALFTATGTLASCGDDTTEPPAAVSVTLTNDDTGVLNYAYLLEQVEAAFYTQVVANFYSGVTHVEKAILTDIRNHEIAHREFFKSLLGPGAIASLTMDFGSIDFTSRGGVLGAAKMFEDLGVSAYNGVARMISNPDYLLLAGKIVSVEARHAATIRDLLVPRNAATGFAGDDIASGDPARGFDGARSPAQGVEAAGMYIKNSIVNNLI